MTRDQMVDYVCDRLVISEEDTARITLITQMLNDTHRRVVAELRLLQNTGSLNTVAGTPTVALPSDLARIRAMTRNTVLMQEISWNEVAGLTLNPNDNGQFYAMRGNSSIYLHPVPETSETGAITVWYDAYPAAMSLGSSEPEAIHPAYHSIIPELVIAKVALAEEEPALAQAAQAMAFEMREQLRLMANDRGGQRPAQMPVVGLRAY
jgi:hypothetical protein